MAESCRVIDLLYETIVGRKGGDPEKSYTAQLFSRGRQRIAQKLGEEGIEVALAGVAEGPDSVISESADLLYHLLVLWADVGVKPDAVWNELAKRQGVSGIEEKKSRKTRNDKR